MVDTTSSRCLPALADSALLLDLDGTLLDIAPRPDAVIVPSGLAAISLNPGVINTEMLQSCFGGSASAYPSPGEWAQTAIPFLLKLGPADNGKQMTAP